MPTQPLARLGEIVGESAVSEDSELIPTGRQSVEAAPVRPWLTVRPTTAGQVQQIVAWANETATPLVPLSSGGPHVHGGSAPSVAGAVRVDLRAMKKIARIDRRQRLALIEPGVTFGELVPALREHGLRINLPLIPRAKKSVLASLIEREPVLVPRWHWNMTEPLRTMEIIWGNGDRLLTGSQTKTDRDEDWASGVIPIQGGGPAQVDFLRMLSGAQGAMGIATWASVKIEPASDHQELVFIPATKLSDLIDCAYRLLKFRFGDETFIVNDVTLARLLTRDPAERASLAAAMPRWCLVVGIGGGSILGAEKVAAREADIREIVLGFGLKVIGDLTNCPATRFHEMLQGPSEDSWWREGPTWASRDIFFNATLDRTPDFVSTMKTVSAGMGDPSDGIGVYIQPMHMGAEVHCELMLPFDPTDAEQSARVTDLFTEGTQALFRQGAYFGRPYGDWSELVFSADAESTAATRKMKAIFDPNHVMNPGKLCF
jgi:FAD/FMN-containing dehydrogenase